MSTPTAPEPEILPEIVPEIVPGTSRPIPVDPHVPQPEPQVEPEHG